MDGKVEWNAGPTLDRLKAAVNVGIFRGAEKVKGTAQDKIHGPPKTGRIYRKGGNVVHQASAPGEAPATDTGRLAGSGQFAANVRTEYDLAKMSGRVIFSTNYAAALEFGTQTIAPRPFLRPSLSQNRDFIRQAVEQEIAAVTK